MKITDRRCGWAVEGQHVATIQAHAVPTADEMLAYYGLQPTDKKYAELAQPWPHPRYVLKKLNGHFIIVPINPDVYAVS